MQSRRNFIKNSILATPPFIFPAFFQSNRKKLDLLVLGGTNYVGYYIVLEALKRGHNVTLLNRGVTNPHLFKNQDKIKVDRNMAGALNKISSKRKWSAAIDTWQESPGAVAESCTFLKDKVKQYAYISTMAVYGGKNYRTTGLTEDAVLPGLPASLDNLHYPQRKQLAEKHVQDVFANHSSIYRAHTITGTDSYGRLDNKEIGIGYTSYWPARLCKGGEIVAPGDPEKDTMQYTDVKDFARFIIFSLEKGNTGIYNVCNTLTMQEYFKALAKNCSSNYQLKWAPAKFIFDQGLESFTDVPFWVSHNEVENGFFKISNDKAVRAGLSFRNPSQSFREIFSSYKKHHSDFDFKNQKTGIKLAIREAELLDKLKSKSQ